MMGQDADLAERFGRKSERVIRACLLVDLLTDASHSGSRVPFHGIRIANATILGDVDIDASEVSHLVELRLCEFKGKLDLSGCHFKKDLWVNKCRLRYARFQSVKIDGDAVFIGSTFPDRVDFLDAHVAGNFTVSGSSFPSRTKQPDFQSVRVGGNANLSAIVCENTVQCTSMHVEGDVYLFGAQLKRGLSFHYGEIGGSLFASDLRVGEVGALDLVSLNIGKDASLGGGIMRGGADLSRAVVGGSLEAKGVQFLGPASAANFASIRIAGSTLLEGALFEGPVRFGGATTGGQLSLSRFEDKPARFLQSADFNGVKVGTDGFFDYAEFEGPVDFSAATFGRGVTFDHARFKSKAKCTWRGLTVGTVAYFTDASFTGTADFSRMKVGDILSFDNTRFAEPRPSLSLDATTYQRISRLTRRPGQGKPDEENGRRNLLYLINNRVSYSEDAYSQIESHFSRQGHVGWANQAYIDRRWRETMENASWLVKPFHFLWYVLVGFGRVPGLAFLYSFVFIVLGCLLYPERKMTLQKPAETPPHPYSPLAYSLDLYLPFLDLRADDAWQPRPDYVFGWRYLRLHTLAGWTLIPIGLAALTGLIK
jgi:hypothetical protein